MITGAQNQIINQIDDAGVTKALGDMGYWFSGEEENENGDRIFEFIACDKPKILIVIEGKPGEITDEKL